MISVLYSIMEFIGPTEEPVEQKILCCECGTLITPNPANMCVACIRTRVDISENIPKQVCMRSRPRDHDVITT